MVPVRLQPALLLVFVQSLWTSGTHKTNSPLPLWSVDIRQLRIHPPGTIILPDPVILDTDDLFVGSSAHVAVWRLDAWSSLDGPSDGLLGCVYGGGGPDDMTS